MKKKMKVLIADDSVAIVERLVDLLRDVPGVQFVGQAGDVQEAIRSVQEKNPDTLILDLQMPGGSGLDVLRAIRPGRPALHVMVCTNYSTAWYREECIAAGSDIFVDKSTEFEKIPAILSGWIEDENGTMSVTL
jgi:DNA-binding NarL/FixJ family response regulator